MRYVSEHEWELLKQQTATHLRDRSWLGGGHVILPHPDEIDSSTARSGAGTRSSGTADASARP